MTNVVNGKNYFQPKSYQYSIILKYSFLLKKNLLASRNQNNIVIQNDHSRLEK